MGARDILAELARIGAIGSSVPKTEEPKLESVTLEQGPPGETFIDERGQSMIEACEKAIMSLDRMMEAQQDLRSAIADMLHTWAAPEEPSEGEVNSFEESEADDEAEEPILLTRPSSKPAPMDPELQVTSEEDESINDFLSELEENQSSFADEV